MDTKLTSTIEKEVIERAKQYASGKGKSLAELVENFQVFNREPGERSWWKKVTEG